MEICDCDDCIKREICPYCNKWLTCCNCVSELCPTCNEHLIKKYGGEVSCQWNHKISHCQYCKLPLYDKYVDCSNHHFEGINLCKECGMPEEYGGKHYHDDTLCKKCGTLLSRGKCIYKCNNGGKRCVYCYYEGIVDNMCLGCGQNQTIFSIKAAIK